MNKAVKIVLLFAPFFPFLFFFLMASNFPIEGIYDFTINMVFIICFFGILGFYIYDVQRGRSVAHDKKRLWTALLIFSHFWVFPFYWYKHIWKNPANNQNS